MTVQLYIDNFSRRFLTSQISRFIDIYKLKLSSVFENIDEEAEEYGNSIYDKAMESCCDPDTFDPALVAESAFDHSLERFDTLSHGKYILISSWHVALYEAFIQQLRNFLHKELSHDFNVSIHHIFDRFKDIKQIFIGYNVDLGSIEGLREIEILGLLSNVIKHGEGSSAIQLRKKSPSLLKKIDDTELLELYRSSLLEEVLHINEETLVFFGNAITRFWNSFPERSVCNDTKKILKLLNKHCK